MANGFSLGLSDGGGERDGGLGEARGGGGVAGLKRREELSEVEALLAARASST